MPKTHHPTKAWPCAGGASISGYDAVDGIVPAATPVDQAWLLEKWTVTQEPEANVPSHEAKACSLGKTRGEVADWTEKFVRG